MRRRLRTRPLWRTLVDAIVFLLVLTIAILSLERFDLFESLSGRYRVVDGDSLEYRAERIRLKGIDAPELNQDCRSADGSTYACGREARDALHKLIGRSEMTCNINSTDRYGRKLAFCKRDNLDINREMVRLGWAIAYSRHVSTYMATEQQARKERRGMWAGTFETPEDYREKHRRTEGSVTSLAGDDD